jgi:hypothetical protein
MYLLPQAFNFLLFPVQGSFSYDVDEAGKEKTNEHQYCPKTIPSQTLEIHCIRVEENYFYIKQHK